MKREMKRKSKRILSGALILSMGLMLMGCQGKDENAGLENATLFKTMETQDLEGNSVDSSIFGENKLTLVNVWNEGCTPCIDELPILDQLNEDYQDKGVAINGLYYAFNEGISDGSKSTVKQILGESDITYPQLLVSKEMAESEELSNLVGFPTTYFVNSEGKIVDSILGSNDYEGWNTKIEEVLKGIN